MTASISAAETNPPTVAPAITPLLDPCFGAAEIKMIKYIHEFLLNKVKQILCFKLPVNLFKIF